MPSWMYLLSFFLLVADVLQVGAQGVVVSNGVGPPIPTNAYQDSMFAYGFVNDLFHIMYTSGDSKLIMCRISDNLRAVHGCA